MLQPQQVFNPAWFSMDTLEVVFKCPQETGEDGPYAALGHYWYTQELEVIPRPHTVSKYSVWEPCGKEVEEML